MLRSCSRMAAVVVLVSILVVCFSTQKYFLKGIRLTGFRSPTSAR